ncbi:P-loop containing nucleoside triphosphate hydrolase protein [Rhodocollybia butyracea]|uniref:P-loop containing nucleoside triphosphate hydrolase protein n=1 Tax=Rhodocollybia butyracea TaxID=206335 RepID=A0A9P5TXM9_9AGAR|nr:P-loop containing nucleoside triphosphate hydrolase protein [Rhodocollybia butyracea]
MEPENGWLESGVHYFPEPGSTGSYCGGRASQMFKQASNFEIRDSTFQVAAHIINNKIINNSLQSITVPSGYQEGMSNLNSQPSTPVFVGRESLISMLEAHFLEGPSSLAQHKSKIYLLWGLGGAGKTQTAIEFASRFEDRFTAVYLIRAASESLIQASFYDIAKESGLSEATWLSGKRWLEKQKEEWLVIYDNADSPGLNLGSFLPSCRHGNVIITSRNEALVQLTVGSTGMATELKDMDDKDAVKLLSIHAGVQNATIEESSIIMEIAKTLHCFPLALVQAGAYIQQQQCLSTYLERFHSQRAQILAVDMSQSFDDNTLSIYSTWRLSWENLGDSAQEFLRICSQLHFENIPQSLFKRAVQNLGKLSEKHPGQLMNDVIFVLKKVFGNQNEWSDAIMDQIIHQLKSFSLIQVLQDGMLYSMHPLVHQWVFDGLKAQHDVIMGILAISIGNLSNDDMVFVLQIQEHCKWVNPLNMDEIFIWEAFRKLWALSGSYLKELELVQHLLHVSETSNGKEHPETLAIAQNLGVVYRHLGRYKDALGLEEPLLELFEQVLGKQHPSTLKQMHRLAITYWSLGRYDDAHHLQEPLLRLSEKVLGKQHLDTLSRTQNLALTYGKLGRYKDELDLEEPLLKLSEKVLGKDHPATLSRAQNLALSYGKLGRYNSELELEEPLLRKSEKVLGKRHPDTLSRALNLALTYRKFGRYEDALELQGPLLELSEQVLGKEHPATLNQAQSLALTYAKLRRYNHALDLQEPLLKLSEQVLGEQHPDTLRRAQNLAFTYRKLGRYSDALGLQEPLLKLSEKVLGKRHPDTLIQTQSLASTYAKLRRYNDTDHQCARLRFM